jgi:nucleotide-binding universal stress UspA family protein
MEVVCMQRSGTLRAAFLALDNLEADPRLARRIPMQLARRFHALPVAEKDGRVTVAMADPDDQKARTAIQTALGLSSFLVRMDCAEVDALIDAAWNTDDRQDIQMLVCTAPGLQPNRFTQYAEQMSNLLQATPHWLEEIEPNRTPEAERFLAQYNLMLFDSMNHPAFRRLLVDPSSPGLRVRPAAAAEGRDSFACLIARRPRWPLQKILLLISGEEEDGAAVDWMLRIARASHSTVTALAVVPPAPAMYSQRSALAQALPTLLSTNTTMGWRMRNTARLLVEWGIEGTLRLRQGPPDWQIRRELAEKEYDLVVVGTRPHQQWARWLEGNTLHTLLRCSRQPVLITLPAPP